VLVLSDLYWYDSGALEPSLSNTKTIRHGIELALATHKLAPERNIVITQPLHKCGSRCPKNFETVQQRGIGIIALVN
jgi:hypothetical protein